jgi:hypothetical protein
MNVQIPVTWFKREHYGQLRSLFVDGRLFPPTYDEWLEDASTTMVTYQDLNIQAVRVPILPGTFRRWCEQNNTRPDHVARHRFGREMLKKQCELTA